MTETNFKHTDLGLIPHDWEVKTLGEHASIFRGGSPRPIEAFITNSVDGINWLKIGDVAPTDKYFTRCAEKILPSGVAHSRRVYDGDFILSNSMSFGRPYILKIDGCIHDGWLVIQDYATSFNMEYLYYVLSSEYVKAQYISMAAGSSVQNLNKDKVACVQITTPPTLAEQERIAGALSSIDTLIGALTEQIEKKRHIKQGAMQQLLTGKKRLAGFTGAWKSVTFEEVVERFATGLNPRQNFKLNSGGSLFYVTIKDFKDGVLYFDNCDRIDETAFELINKRADLREGDLLFSSIGRVGDAYVIKSTPTNWNINESVYNLRPNYSVITSDFLYHIIKGKELSNKIQDAVTGSTLRSIKMNHLKQISFSIPPTIAEQSAIAAVLSRMDTEIEALEQKRDKYIAIKSGMMQNLLTGKIRLV